MTRKGFANPCPRVTRSAESSTRTSGTIRLRSRRLGRRRPTSFQGRWNTSSNSATSTGWNSPPSSSPTPLCSMRNRSAGSGPRSTRSCGNSKRSGKRSWKPTRWKASAGRRERSFATRRAGPGRHASTGRRSSGRSARSSSGGSSGCGTPRTTSRGGSLPTWSGSSTGSARSTSSTNWRHAGPSPAASGSQSTRRSRSRRSSRRSNGSSASSQRPSETRGWCSSTWMPSRSMPSRANSTSSIGSGGRSKMPSSGRRPARGSRRGRRAMSSHPRPYEPFRASCSRRSSPISKPPAPVGIP